MALDTAPFGSEESNFTLPANVGMEAAKTRNMSSRTIFSSFSRELTPVWLTVGQRALESLVPTSMLAMPPGWLRMA
jgi:hypothetical protein